MSVKSFFIYISMGLAVSVSWYLFWGELDYRIRPVLSDNEFEEVIALGEPIIKSIEKYYADTGEYPTNIEKLIPSYVAQEQVYTNTGLQMFYVVLLKPWADGQKTDKYLLLYSTKRGYKMFNKYEDIEYNPNHNYPELKHTKTIKVYKGWAQRIQYPVPKEEAEMLQYWHDNPPGNIFEKANQEKVNS